MKCPYRIKTSVVVSRTQAPSSEAKISSVDYEECYERECPFYMISFRNGNSCKRVKAELGEDDYD